MPASVSIFEAANLARWLRHQHSGIAACAHGHLLRTARFEAASGTDTCQIWSLSLNSGKPHSAVSRVQEVALGNTHQRFGIRMQGPTKDIFYFPLFNNSPGVHDHDAIGKSRKDGWIMTNQQKRSAMLLAN